MNNTLNLSQALSIFEDHLPDIRKACVENIRALQAGTPLSDDAEFTATAISQHVEHLRYQEAIRPMLNVIKRIDSRKLHYRSSHKITDEQIAKAKEVLLEELYEGQLYGKKRKYGLCPFHNEKSPSFYIFPDNRFHCFGCAAHGTAIDFVMLRDNLTFLEATKKLTC